MAACLLSGGGCPSPAPTSDRDALCPSQERSPEDLDREWELYVGHLQQTSSDLHRVFNSLWALDKTKVPPWRAGACYLLRFFVAQSKVGRARWDKAVWLPLGA